MNLASRSSELELMDINTYPRVVLEETLDFLEFTNKYFGGARVFLNYFKKVSRNWKPDEVITILDVGTGSADIPKILVKWARRNKFSLRIKAIDLLRDVVEIAKVRTADYDEITVCQQDFFKIEGVDFDYVMGALFLHHMTNDEIIRCLRRADALSRRGVIFYDLNRSHAGYWSTKLLARILGNDVIRNDGPLSVARAFRKGELEGLTSAAGTPSLTVRRADPFRLSLSVEKS